MDHDLAMQGLIGGWNNVMRHSGRTHQHAAVTLGVNGRNGLMDDLRLTDHDLAMTRRAEDAAKAMYDPFKRISLEQTWSGGGLLTNLKQQQEIYALLNLDKDKKDEEGSEAAAATTKVPELNKLKESAHSKKCAESFKKSNYPNFPDVEASKKAAYVKIYPAEK